MFRTRDSTFENFNGFCFIMQMMLHLFNIVMIFL